VNQLLHAPSAPLVVLASAAVAVVVVRQWRALMTRPPFSAPV
jgi:hypothetical protein